MADITGTSCRTGRACPRRRHDVDTRCLSVVSTGWATRRARAPERHLQRLRPEAGHVGEQPVVVQQQGRRGRLASPATASGRRPRRRRRPGRAPRRRSAARRSAGRRTASVDRGRRPATSARSGHRPARGSTGGPLLICGPGSSYDVPAQRAPSPTPGVLRDDGDLDLPVEVAGADRRGDAWPAPGRRRRRSRSRRSTSPGSSARAGRSGRSSCGPTSSANES